MADNMAALKSICTHEGVGYNRVVFYTRTLCASRVYKLESDIRAWVERLRVAGSDEDWKRVPRVRKRLAPEREYTLWCEVAERLFANEPPKRAYHLFNRRRRYAKSKAPPQVLYLHGHHMNGGLFKSLTKKIRPKRVAHKRHIFVDAPYECPDGPKHRGWYEREVVESKGGEAGVEAEIDWNLKTPLTNEEAEYDRFWLEHMHRRRSALVGFSEGARFALRFAMRHPERVSHLVLIGMPCSALELEAMRDAWRDMPRIPIAVVGSPEDEQCSYTNMVRAADRLGATEFVTYGGGHRVVLRKDVRDKILLVLDM